MVSLRTFASAAARARCWRFHHRVYSTSSADAQKSMKLVKDRLKFLESARERVQNHNNKLDYQSLSTEIGIKVPRHGKTTFQVQQELAARIDKEIQESRIALASLGGGTATSSSSSSFADADADSDGPGSAHVAGGFLGAVVAIAGTTVYLKGGTPLMIPEVQESGTSQEASCAAFSAGSPAALKASEATVQEQVATAGATNDLDKPIATSAPKTTKPLPAPGQEAQPNDNARLKGTISGGQVWFEQLDDWAQGKLGLQPGEFQQGLMIASAVLGVGLAVVLTYRCLAGPASGDDGGGGGPTATVGDRGGSGEIPGSGNAAGTGGAPPDPGVAATASSAVEPTAPAQTIVGRSPTAASSSGAGIAVPGRAAEGIASRRAGEQIFENQPDPNQAWDMSASVRGISGGVKHAARKFDKQ